MGDMDSSSASNDDYILNGDASALVRLKCQHYFWHRKLGYSLHASIPMSSLGGRPRSGSTSGLAAPNVSLTEWNMFGPPLADLASAYGIVFT